jgi:hypothetical protein
MECLGRGVLNRFTLGEGKSEVSMLTTGTTIDSDNYSIRAALCNQVKSWFSHVGGVWISPGGKDFQP